MQPSRTTGSRVDQGVLQQHDNVFLVLSGHEHGVDIEVRQDVGTEGNHIVELLVDYQFYEVSAEEPGLTGIDNRNPDDMLRFGSSFFRMLQIDVDNSELAVDTYSPLLDNFGATEYDDRQRYNGTEDDTRLPIQLETRKTSFSTESVMVTTPTDDVIGEATARSGWPASVEWSGLTEGETYAWYAVSRDAESGEDLPTGEAQQMGVFTATTAGTDDVAPELTVPEAATIAAGDAFDPMAGVSATDNADGDLTAAVQVMTDLDTTTPGVYVVTYLVEDSTGNQATATRAVTVTEAAADSTEGDQNGDDQNGDSDDTEQNVEGEDTTKGDDASDGADPVSGTDTPGGAHDGDGPLDDEATAGSATDVENAEGFLANTGANGTVLLVLGGLLSIAFGLSAWQISRRRSAMN
ncbi:hypothetical protein J2S62_002230 [Enteractinococcus fodinae]|uniref:Pesticidal crystal protein Cry22Aa Ig-like domain-containing protein n=1 Tax=Enteractinococcus fodinae TaxID=684663 RepID=A0ABU2B5E2_9MICC|nr:hypothetical protein [Enteractinococcus fodinae]